MKLALLAVAGAAATLVACGVPAHPGLSSAAGSPMGGAGSGGGAASPGFADPADAPPDTAPNACQTLEACCPNVRAEDVTSCIDIALHRDVERCGAVLGGMCAAGPGASSPPDTSSSGAPANPCSSRSGSCDGSIASAFMVECAMSICYGN